MSSETVDAPAAAISGSNDYRGEFLSPAERAGAPGLEAAWRKIVARNDHLTAILQAPAYWTFHLARQPAHTYLSGVAYASRQEVVGVLPTMIRPVPLIMDAGATWEHCA